MDITIAIAVMVLLTLAYAVSSIRASATIKRAKRERSEIYRNCFLKGLAGILAKMAKADGTVSADEEKIVKRLFGDMGLPSEDLKVCFDAYRTAKDSTLSASYYASLFAPYSTKESKLLVYEVLWDIAAADERFASDEDKFLRELIGWLGLEQSAYDVNLRTHAKKFSEVDAAIQAAGRKLDSVVRQNVG